MKKSKIFKICFVILAFIISINVAIIYISAPLSNADDNIVVADKDIVIDTSGKVPVFENAIDCYLYAEAKLAKTTCYSKITGYVKGLALDKVMVHQTMNNERIIDNNLYCYSTSRSEKKADLGKNNYQKVAFDNKSENGLIYKMVTDKLNDDGTPNYTNCKWQTFNQKDYEEKNGSLPGTMMYLIRESTVRRTEIFEKLEDGSYHFKFLLNNRSSVISYKKLVRQSAGSYATSYPAFSHVGFEAWVDANGNFIKYIMDDTATISMGISALSIDCTMISHYEENFITMGGNVERPFEVPFAS